MMNFLVCMLKSVTLQLNYVPNNVNMQHGGKCIRVAAVGMNLYDSSYMLSIIEEGPKDSSIIITILLD